MEMLTARMVAEKAELPYRRLLDWVDKGWFSPRVVARGGERNQMFFDLEDVVHLRAFDRIRHRFEEREWAGVLSAIQQLRGAQERGRFVVASKAPATEGGVKYRTVGEGELAALLHEPGIMVIVAVPTEEVKKKR